MVIKNNLTRSSMGKHPNHYCSVSKCMTCWHKRNKREKKKEKKKYKIHVCIYDWYMTLVSSLSSRHEYIMIYS